VRLFLYDKETLVAIHAEPDKNKAERIALAYLNLGLNVRSEEIAC